MLAQMRSPLPLLSSLALMALIPAQSAVKDLLDIKPSHRNKAALQLRKDIDPQLEDLAHLLTLDTSLAVPASLRLSGSDSQWNSAVGLGGSAGIRVSKLLPWPNRLVRSPTVHEPSSCPSGDPMLVCRGERELWPLGCSASHSLMIQRSSRPQRSKSGWGRILRSMKYSKL